MADFYLLPEPFFWAWFFIIGSIFGSFANVIIYRWPEGESFIAPRSRCPSCKKTIPFYLNIPVLSWLILRGRCKNCEASISWRYPFVEFLTGILFVALYVKVGWSWLLVEYLIFAFGLVVVTFIDLDHMLLPDLFTLGGIVVGLLGALLNPERTFWPAFGGVLLGGGFLWLIAYLYLLLRKEDGMGGGDIKLLGWIGAVLSWKAIPFVILASSIIGSVVGLIAAAKSEEGLKTAIPFGPYLVLGALIYIFGGQSIGEWYLGLFLVNV